VEIGGFLLGPNNTRESGIYEGDARELILSIPDQSFDFVFTDPPYWVGFDYGNRSDEDMAYIEPEWIVSELTRVAPLVCITPGIANLYDYPRPEWIVAWLKPASTGRSNLKGFNTWEPILVYGEVENPFWQDTIRAQGGREFSGAFNGCPKPIKLLDTLIAGMTPAQGTVLDPLVGSGTTAVSAKRLGRCFLAFEKDSETVELARNRVRNTQEPLLAIENSGVGDHDYQSKMEI
jgi:site-specific DNA-methyltransferase (adenine-specific)